MISCFWNVVKITLVRSRPDNPSILEERIVKDQLDCNIKARSDGCPNIATARQTKPLGDELEDDARRQRTPCLDTK